jgi:hypothetical protein
MMGQQTGETDAAFFRRVGATNKSGAGQVWCRGCNRFVWPDYADA